MIFIIIYNRYSLFHNQNCVNLTPKSKDVFVAIMMTNAIGRKASNLSLLKNTPAGVSEDYMDYFFIHEII